MIELDRKSGVSLYQQIYEQLKDYIENQTLDNNEKLMSIRDCAKYLGVSKNTIELAYQMLTTDGYVVNKKGSGYYVNYIPEKKQEIMNLPKRKAAQNITYDLSGHLFMHELFGKRYWRVCVMKAMDELQSMDMINRPSHNGDAELRRLIANFLLRFRGVRCKPEQVIITSNLINSAYIICSMFASEIFSFVLENPSYNSFKQVLNCFRFNTEYIKPIDDNFDVDTLNQYKNIILYLTPVHNIIAGTSLSEKMRQKLLDWVSTSNSYIIEDDCDAEIYSAASPAMSMQAKDVNERVIHIGDFRFMLSPAINMGYIVLPEHLCVLYKNFFENSICTVPLLSQYTIKEYAKSGHLQRYIKFYREKCQYKYQLMKKSMQEEFGDKIDISDDGMGFAMVVRVKNGMSERELIFSAGAREVKVAPVSVYYEAPEAPPFGSVMLLYTGIRENDIPKAAARLREAWLGNEY